MSNSPKILTSSQTTTLPQQAQNNNASRGHINSNNVTVSSKFANYDITSPLAHENPNSRPLRGVLIEEHWWQFATKYLSDRSIETQLPEDIRNLRLTCKAIRDAFFSFYPFQLRVNAALENIITLYKEKKLSLGFLSTTFIKTGNTFNCFLNLVVSDNNQLSQLLQDINTININSGEENQQWHFVAKKITVKSEGAIAGLEFKELPSSVTNFEWDAIIPMAGVVDLRLCTSVTVVSVKSLKGKLFLPSSVTDFQVKEMPHFYGLDLISYTNLKKVKIKDLNGKCILPLNIESFEERGLNNLTVLIRIDLSPYSHLTTVKVAYFERIEKLPSNLEYLEAGVIKDCVSADLTPYSNLKVVKISTLGNNILKLPSNLESFECSILETDAQLDFTLCCCLTVVKIGRITNNDRVGRQKRSDLGGGYDEREQTLDSLLSEIGIVGLPLFPPSIEYLEWGGLIDVGDTLDLSHCIKLTTVKLNDINIKGNLKLPSSIVRFECKTIGAIATIDLTSCSGLMEVRVWEVKGRLNLPTNLMEFTCEVVESDNLDLSHCTDLLVVIIWMMKKALKLPANLKTFVCEIMESDIDLSSYPNLTKVYIGDVRGTLKLPTCITEVEGVRVHTNGVLDASNCPNLLAMRGIMVNGNLILPASITTLEGIIVGIARDWDYLTYENPNVVLDLSCCNNLLTLKGISIKNGVLKLPSSVTCLENLKISTAVALDLSHCVNLTILKVEIVQGTLILSRQYHSALADNPDNILPSTNNIIWN